MPNPEENKKKFIEIYARDITRPGSEELMEWLQKSDFFVSPASTRFHGSYPGGLCEHSLNVYDNLMKLWQIYGDDFAHAESLALVSLLHDLCKTNFYGKEMKNVKNPDIARNKQLIMGDVMIDDGIHNLIGGKYEKLLFDRNHNRSVDEKKYGCIRVHSWDEIYAKIRKLSEEVVN